MPSALETGHILGRGLPGGVPPLALVDELFVLGWSRANKLAYLERRSMPAQPEVNRFQIIDLVEDRVVFVKEWPSWGSGVSKESWWADHEDEFSDLFLRFQLTPVDAQLGLFPLILDNEFYTLVLRTTLSQTDSSWIERLEVVVNSSGRGIKTVRDEIGYWRWAAVLGFLPSPFENRLALVLLVQPAGWLGTTQPLRFQVSGLSLKAGFPKP